MDITKNKITYKKRSRKNQHITLFIPENIDIDKLLELKPPKFKYNRDSFVYILHLITEIPSKLSESKNEYVYLYSPLLQRRIKNYREYLDYLIHFEILVTDNQYSQIERKSIGYKYNVQYNTAIKPVSINKYTLIKSISKHIDLGNKSISSQNRPIAINSLEYLNKWFNSNLTIDYIRAKEYLENLRLEEITNGINEFSAMCKFNSRMIIIEKIHNQDFQFSVDRTVGRVHSLLTQIKSELRQFISYDSFPLVSVDIKNSQPYMSSTLMRVHSFKKNGLCDKIKLYNSLFLENQDNCRKLEAMVATSLKMSDTVKYLSLISKGKLYEYISEGLKLCGTREQAKSLIFSAMFSPNQSIGSKKEIIEFAKEFPSVYNLFKFVKKNKHNTLACILQNLEAELILHKCCKLISEKHPAIPIFTLHDSIITTEGNERLVHDILFQILTDNIGIPPNLKIEKWGNKIAA